MSKRVPLKTANGAPALEPAETATPLIDRLIWSAVNAERLLKEGSDLSGLSDDEILVHLNSAPIVPD